MRNMMIKLTGIIWLIISLSLVSCQPWYLPITYQLYLYHQPIRYGESIEMPAYSVKAPSGEGWGFATNKETGNIFFIKNKVSRFSQVIGNTEIHLLENRELSQEKWQLNEDEFGNDFINAEENKEINKREKVSKDTGRKSILENVSKGVTNIDGKKIYFLKYKIFRWWGADTEVDLYLFIPPNFKETYIFYTFRIEENYIHGERKHFQVDLDQILPVIRSFQVKNITGE